MLETQVIEEYMGVIIFIGAVAALYVLLSFMFNDLNDLRDRIHRDKE